jgi:hypothetical protein
VPAAEAVVGNVAEVGGEMGEVGDGVDPPFLLQHGRKQVYAGAGGKAQPVVRGLGRNFGFGGHLLNSMLDRGRGAQSKLVVRLVETCMMRHSIE